MSDVMFRKDGHVASVRLNRPAGLNAITPEMDGMLSDAWATINDDPDIWVAVLSAEGEKSFCIGADVSGGTDRVGRMALGGGLTGIGGPLVTLKKPLIAAVQGFCVGGGFELARPKCSAWSALIRSPVRIICIAIRCGNCRIAR